jgi:hypothetical protein
MQGLELRQAQALQNFQTDKATELATSFAPIADIMKQMEELTKKIVATNTALTKTHFKSKRDLIYTINKQR